jgi:hypothetical protein
VELDYLRPDKVEQFILPDFPPEVDGPATLRLQEAISEIRDSFGFKAILHIIAIQYRQALEQLASPRMIEHDHMVLLKGRLWGLSEILDIPGAVEDRARELKEAAKNENPSTGGGR